MKRLALLVLVLAAVGVPSTAHAAVPCRDKIYNDWYADGKIDTNYPIACYKDALAHVPVDAQIYSNLTADIHAAMQGAISRGHGKTVPAQIGKGNPADKTVKLSSTTPATPATPASSTTTLASGATSSGGGSGLPVPIIVLGALAILLAAAGAAGAGIRHVRNRQP